MRSLLLLVPLLAVALAQEPVLVKEGEAPASEAEAREVPPPSCEEQCITTYPGDEEEATKNQKACHYGCRMLNILDALHISEDIKTSCESDCKEAHNSATEQSACNAGCAFQMPVLESRRHEMTGGMNPLDSFLGGLPRIRIAVPMSMSGMMPRMGSMGNMMPNMPNMPDIGKIFGQMDRMMKSLTSQVDKIENGEIPEGSGRLVVVKSGPGFHHQKTYNFGPDGMETKTEERTSSDKEKNMAQDMMSAPNPLERFFNLGNDVEMIEPKSESESSESSAPINPFLAARTALERLMSSSDSELEQREEMEEQRVQQAIEQAIEQSANERPRWEVMDEPRLPEEGLKTRHHPEVYVMRQAMCAQKSENMKWSDWVTCLHLRMGLPRWLTAATISLGIVFIIWLCLVIPQNAPKQKVMSKKSADNQLCFANLAAMDMPLKDGEMPPAYEEIADLHVAISASHESKRKEAEASCAAVKVDQEI